MPSPGSTPHGSGLRENTTLLRSPIIRLGWADGGAELIDRINDTPAEFRMTVNRHAWLFGFQDETRDQEILIDGRRVSFGHRHGPSIRVIPAGATLSGWCEDGRLHYLVAFFDPGFLLRGAGEGWRPGLEIRYASGAGEPASWHLAHALRAECESGGACGPLYAESLALALALRLLHEHSNLGVPRPPVRGALANWRLRRVVEHMHDRIGEPVTLTELAAAAGVSPSHLSHAFRAATGEAPHRYHLRLRIEHAKTLLANAALPLADVALICGFPGQSHFTTVFRRATGLTPGRWRERARH